MMTESSTFSYDEKTKSLQPTFEWELGSSYTPRVSLHFNPKV